MLLDGIHSKAIFLQQALQQAPNLYRGATAHIVNFTGGSALHNKYVGANGLLDRNVIAAAIQVANAYLIDPTATISFDLFIDVTYK